MRYPPQIIEQIKARVSLVDEVRKTIPAIKKKGRYWWACCPFHGEKSPSFHIREEQGSYYCFGCGAKGDIFSYIQETQGGNFNDTVKRLAAQAGIKLPEPEYVDPAATERRQDGYKVLERAAIFFERSLQGNGGETARAYLEKRSLTATTVQEFGLGYSPEGWNGLRDALATEGFGPEILREAGLTVQSDKGRGDYDRFRNRLMFPIHDAQARVVGFGGRVMDKSEPKYLNSADTPFFNKSFLLYNLHRAKPHIRATKTMVLVEGYVDVISLWQAGFKTAVAPMGTAVTEDQLVLMWQQLPTPTVCLDGDSAGRTAAIRAAQRALPVLEPGRTLNFVFLPQGEDPDSLVQRDGLGVFLNLMAQPVGLEAVLWQHLSAMGDLSTADGRALVEAEISAMVNSIKDQTVKRQYGRALRDRLWQAGRAAGGNTFSQKAKKAATPMLAPTNYVPAIQGDGTARGLLALACRYPTLVADHTEAFAQVEFPDGALKDLAQTLVRHVVMNRVPADEVVQMLKDGPHGVTVTELEQAAPTPDNEGESGTLFAHLLNVWQEERNLRLSRRKQAQQGRWLDPDFWQSFQSNTEKEQEKKREALTGGAEGSI